MHSAVCFVVIHNQQLQDPSLVTEGINSRSAAESKAPPKPELMLDFLVFSNYEAKSSGSLCLISCSSWYYTEEL